LRRSPSSALFPYTTLFRSIEDYRRLMRLADYQSALPKDKETLLKINISWDTWYPACSTAPWQLEAAIQELQEAGYRVKGAHNDTDRKSTRLNSSHVKISYA